MKLPKLPSIRELLNLYQINPQKKLSQNFISNKYAQQFVKLNDSYHNQLVIEIGSGPGGLTRQLLSTNVKKLIGIEKDSRFEPILSQLQTASGNRFQYQIADILDDKDGALSNQILDSHHQIGYGVLLVGNLPFSISGLVLNQWIRQALLNQGLFRINNIELLLIFSNEVGQRLIPNHGKRTRFSALTQTAFQITDTMVIPNSGFDPVPNCDCMGIKLIRNPSSPTFNEFEYDYYVDFLKFFYSLPNKLARVPMTKIPNGLEILDTAGIELNSRVYSIPVEKLIQLSTLCLSSGISSDSFK